MRGQYSGYREVDGVAPDSTVETFVAMRLEIDTWRWAGVPFYIRTGKGLPVTATEIVVRLKEPLQDVFGEHRPPDGDYLRFALKPHVSISLGVRSKALRDAMVGQAVEMYACRDAGDARPPYQRLIGDACDGDQALFARQDAIEAAWRVLGGVLDDRTPVHSYEPGSWGPAQADRVLARGHQWRAPLPPGSGGHLPPLTSL